jgi:hypothetical protein
MQIMTFRQYGVGTFLTLLVGICIFSSGSSAAGGTKQLQGFCLATIDEASGIVTYYPPGCNLIGSSGSTGGLNSNTTTGTTQTTTTSTTTTTGGLNATTSTTATTGFSTGISTATNGTDGTSTGTTATNSGGDDADTGDDDNDQLPDTPVLNILNPNIGLLSWTAEDITFQLGFTEQSNLQVLEIKKVQLQIRQKTVMPPTNKIVCPWVELDAWVTGDTMSNIRRKIRLDSTEFINDSQLHFEFKLTFKWKKKGTDGNWLPPQDSEEETSASGDVKNYVLTFATQKPSTSTAYINGNFTYGETAVKGMPRVRSEVNKGLRFASFPKVPVPQSTTGTTGTAVDTAFLLGRDAIVSNVQNPSNSAAIVAMTHGSYNGFWDKDVPLKVGDSNTATAGYVRYILSKMIYTTDSEPAGDNSGGNGVSAAFAFSRPTHSPVNSFLLYACETGRKNIDGVSDRLAKKTIYAGVSGQTMPPNRFVTGFEDLVHSNVVRSINEIPTQGLRVSKEFNLCDHATLLVRNLKLGFVSLDALRIANEDFLTLTSSAPRTYAPGSLGTQGWHKSTMSKLKHGPMILQGDPDALWKGLYLKDIDQVAKPRIENVLTKIWLYLFKGRG